MGFKQEYHHVVNVYNINGDLILSAESTREDLAEQLQRIKKELSELPGLPSSTRDQVAAALDEAAKASRSQTPDKKGIADKINNAGTLIEKTSGIAENAIKLAKTLFTIASWVGTVL